MEPESAAPDKPHFSWLHLSDWHQGLPDYDRRVLLERMLEDIGKRGELDSKDSKLADIDLVIFSGDVAFSGQKAEYDATQRDLIDPLKEILGAHTAFFFAPGNHDLDRNRIKEIPREWDRLLASGAPDRQKKIGDLLYDRKKAPTILAPFENFYQFSGANGCEYPEGKIIVARTFKRGNASVGIVAINTAFCCARHNVQSVFDDKATEPWDYGVLSITEQQLKDAISKVKGCAVKFLVMHHPITWMHELEQPQLEQWISTNFDLVLYGHEHLPRFTSVSGNFGDIKFVPAGSAYASRWNSNSRYTNAFNFGAIDVPSGEGAIHHRRWMEEKDQWVCDERYWPEGIARFMLQSSLPENRKYLFEAQRKYKRYHPLRPLKEAEIILKHEPVVVDGRKFVQATVRYRLEFYPGPPGKFPFGTQANKRVLHNASDEIRRRAFTVISQKPRPTQSVKDPGDGTMIRGLVDLPAGKATVEYHYQMLESEDGVWTFVLGRFIDKVRIILEQAEGYQYEYMPLGGFPDRQPSPDGVFKFATVDSDAGHLPHQGYLVQWYPAGT